jgi:hypothetical protein
MSKFIYILHRKDVKQEDHDHVYNRIKNNWTFANGEWTNYIKGATQFFIYNSAPNVQVDADLNFVINLPNSNEDSTALLKIYNGERYIEARGDMVGSRVIWYYSDENQLILSSSQRAIVTVLGDFEPNRQAWTWMLANGSLGPGFSWDKRIHALEPGGILRFDKGTWKLNIVRHLWRFDYRKAGVLDPGKELAERLDTIVSDFHLNDVATLLTLSGGSDSRAALYLLKKNNPQLHTATWGVPVAFEKAGTDATVARQVSDKWGTQHSEYNVQFIHNFDKALNIFLLHGEGRNDHINSFMDGLQMWGTIADQGYAYVIRADEAFGWLPVRTELDARTSVAFAQLPDFRNIPNSVIDSLPKQVVPEHLNRFENEALEDYRDRLYQQYRLPFVIGPLQDLPLSFVEVLNPLLHPQLISFVRSLPPQLRTEKRLYATWVDKLLPNVPYATVPAIPEAYHVAEEQENESMFTDFFVDTGARNVLGQELMDFLQSNWKAKKEGSVRIHSIWKRQMRTMLPIGLKKFLRNNVTGYQLNVSSLALRAYIIYRMQYIMQEAAEKRIKS